MLVLYPTVIAPLFNKFEPLADESLKRARAGADGALRLRGQGPVRDGRQQALGPRAMPTSPASAPPSAWCSSTRCSHKLTPGEVEAVLAHELGHFKHRHVTKRIVLMFALSLAGFALLGWLSTQTWFYTGLGVAADRCGAPNDALALLLFLLVVPVFGFFVSPLFAQLSRRHEFEADAYACARPAAATWPPRC